MKDLDKSHMVGFSLPPISSRIPDPLHELHLKHVAERERVSAGCAKRKPKRIPADITGGYEKGQFLFLSDWQSQYGSGVDL